MFSDCGDGCSLILAQLCRGILFSTVQQFGASPEMLHLENWKPVLGSNIKECTGCTVKSGNVVTVG
jgi:hypothetical protein